MGGKKNNSMITKQRQFIFKKINNYNNKKQLDFIYPTAIYI